MLKRFQKSYLALIVITFILAVFAGYLFVRIKNFDSQKNSNIQTQPAQASSEIQTKDPIKTTVIAGSSRVLVNGRFLELKSSGEALKSNYSLILKSIANANVLIEVDLGTYNKQYLVRFKKPDAERKIVVATLSVDNFKKELKPDLEIELELGFTPESKDQEDFIKNFEKYLADVNLASSTKPFTISRWLVKGINIY